MMLVCPAVFPEQMFVPSRELESSESLLVGKSEITEEL